MTCREFKRYVASFSSPTPTADPQLAAHAQACPACESWFEAQQTLNASLHALRARTAGHEAGPDVERALLQVFRQGIPAGKASRATAPVAVAAAEPMPSGVRETWKMWRPQSEAAPGSTPFALRLSRLFELGAYAAVAAAIAVAIFLGIHMVQHGSSAKPMQSKSAPGRSVPVIEQPIVVASDPKTADLSDSHTLQPKHGEAPISHRVLAQKSPVTQTVTSAQGGAEVADDSQSDAEAAYTALMFCDPLSCSGETQVVRMELPESASAASQGAQPAVADLVVGYDGVVRAVRWVN